MARILAATLAMSLAVTGLLAQTSQETPAPTEKKVNHNPDAAQLIASDIPNFWRAFDQMNPENGLFVLKREYLDKGSIGLKDFSKARFTG